MRTFLMPRSGLRALALVGAALVPRAAPAELSRFQYTEVHMGMQTRIVLYASDEARARSAAATGFRRIEELDAVLSDYRPSSEIRKLCDRAGSGPVRVSLDLWHILSWSHSLARRSNGAFDITCGPVVQLWRQARRSGRLPDADSLAQALRLAGWRNLVLHHQMRAAELRLPGMRLDLGGIAKGFACDEALKALRRHGLRMAMVEMGGDIALGDAPPGKPGWLIEIPNAEGTAARMCYLTNVCVSTSGDTEQYVEIGGVRYSHIVDPRTGLGLTSRIGVTVIARHGWLSDGLSTAISVLGEEEGRALARRYGVERLYIRTAP